MLREEWEQREREERIRRGITRARERYNVIEYKEYIRGRESGQSRPQQRVQVVGNSSSSSSSIIGNSSDVGSNMREDGYHDRVSQMLSSYNNGR